MKNFLTCLLFTLLGCGAASATCTSEKTTALVFGNGINNSYDDAWISLHTVLRPAVSQAAGPDIDKSCVGYWLAYDSTFVDKNNSNAIQRFDGLVAQLVDATVQQGVDFAASFWGYFYSALGAQPSWFADIWRTGFLSATSVFQPDLIRHEAFYNSELALGHKIVAVAHSQGNFYVNQAYATVTALSGADSFKVIGVATPAISVAGSGPYFTLASDVITLVPGSLPPNIVNNPPSPCLSFSIIECHSFDSSYMGVDVQTQTIVGGDRTRPAIVAAVLRLLPKVTSIIFDNFGDRQFCTFSGIGINRSLSCPGNLIGFFRGFPPFAPPAADLKEAFAFDIPPGAGVQLQSLELPLFLLGGTNQITVAVRRDIGGLPDPSSTVTLVTRPNAMRFWLSFFADPTFTTLLFNFEPGTVVLSPGRYWVEVRAPIADTTVTWAWGRTAGYGNVASSANGNPYFISGNPQPGMRVVVSPR